MQSKQRSFKCITANLRSFEDKSFLPLKAGGGQTTKSSDVQKYKWSGRESSDLYLIA